MKPLVMHVVEAFGGGVFESIKQLCEGTQDSHDILIVHSLRAQTPANYRELFPSSVEFLNLPMVRAINPKADVSHVLALRKLIQQRKPAYVHAHSSKAGALVRLAVLGLPVASGYSPRGYAFLMLDQHPAKRFMYSAIERLLGFLPTTTIACGHDEFAIAKRISRNAIVIPNAIKIEDVPAHLKQRPDYTDELIVVGSGRISPQKNFPLFCEVAEHFAGQNLRFIWVGGGEDGKAPSTPHVQITGWLPQKEAHAILQSGHIYLHLSGWEGLSRAILESMAFGFPLIVSDVVGNRELTSGSNGFICKDKKEVVAALETLRKNPTLLKDMGNASLQHVSGRYNWQNSLTLWKELYNGTPTPSRAG